MQFERGREINRTIGIGKFRDSIKVSDIYHMRHENAKWGTYAIFENEKLKILALEALCGPDPFPISIDTTRIAFRIGKKIKEFYELEGEKIEYKREIYQLPVLHIEL